MDGNLYMMRQYALDTAARVYGNGEHPPQALVLAAEVFEEYLAGTSDEV